MLDQSVCGRAVASDKDNCREAWWYWYLHTLSEDRCQPSMCYESDGSTRLAYDARRRGTPIIAILLLECEVDERAWDNAGWSVEGAWMDGSPQPRSLGVVESLRVPSASSELSPLRQLVHSLTAWNRTTVLLSTQTRLTRRIPSQ